MQEKVLIIDFGSQYTQLIARRIRELNVYCEIYPYNHIPALEPGVKGVVLSGSFYSVNNADSPKPDLKQFRGIVPLLGICFGAQYLAASCGGKVESHQIREYGRAHLARIDQTDALMKGATEGSQVWMSHGDSITRMPENFTVVSTTDSIPCAAFRVEGEKTWGIQFHPEVVHSLDGALILSNFVKDICGCSCDWTPASFIETTVAELRGEIGNDQVILGLSGGVDSTVAAVLLNKAIGKNLICIFVNNGLLRKNEFSTVLDSYKGMGLNVVGVDASQIGRAHV